MDDQSRSSAKKINAMKARQNFGTLLEEVYYRGEIYIVGVAGVIGGKFTVSYN